MFEGGVDMSNPVAYLQVDRLAKSFGDLVLFQNISFGIAEGQRVALIAQNGKGKSTLLSILSGQEDYDSGSVVYRSDLRVAYLKQEPDYAQESTVMEACFSCENETLETISRYEAKMRQCEEMDAEMEELLHLMDYHKAWDYEVRIKQILTRLQIPDFHQKMAHLSGGQRKRVALANALILEPELLILDEPTNHLDLEMIEWLENYLIKSGITLLMVTHDRYFLDRVCNRILEIDNRQLYSYTGNYSYYLEKRQERIEAFDSELERANNLFRRELEWMRSTPQARSSKARYRQEAFAELEEKVSQRQREESIRLDVKASYIGSKIAEIKYVSKSYGQLNLLDDFYYHFARYEKVGIVGKNGTGKTTFLKMLLGLEPCDSGSIDIGQTIRFAYYSQSGLRFDENKKVIDVVREIAEDIHLGDGRRLSASQFLNHFLFSPDTQYKYIHKLSGGEKRRLYLCTVLMRNPNFLVLDEPTNDLDIISLTILEEYLKSFKGCVLVVSHDRYFMDKIVDHLLVFEGNAQVRDFPGNYTQYREWREAKEEELRKSKQEISKQNRLTEKTNAKNASMHRERHKRTYKEQKEFEAIEAEIEALEKQRKEIEDALSSPDMAGADIERLCKELPVLKALLEEKEMRWLALAEIES